MDKEKPVYIFVMEDKIGGIAYLNKNLINNTSLRQGIVVKVILLDQTDSDHPRFPDEVKADEIIRFRYSSFENKYFVLKRFHGLLGNEPGAIICNDGLEMQAIYQFGTQKTVYQIIHDFYNIKLAVKWGAITDVFVTHTNLFRDILMSSDPVSTQAYSIPHGVSIPKIDNAGTDLERLKIVFTGRLVESKGVQDLFDIHQKLLKKGIHAEWTIIGRGKLKAFLEDQWNGIKDIRFISPDTNEEVLSIMSRHDLFVLPTRFEGSPVSILEALGVGIVPVVSDLPGGIRETVNQDVGRRISVGDKELFAEAISDLYYNRPLLSQMKINARTHAEKNFDIRKTSDNYFKVFAQFKELKKDHSNLPAIKPDFRLDKKWLPNALVSFLRRIRNSLR
jgi:glycosyltransferase involved in cell wall biosynthesis